MSGFSAKIWSIRGRGTGVSFDCFNEFAEFSLIFSSCLRVTSDAFAGNEGTGGPARKAVQEEGA
jgi:hypothetical protein